MAEPTVQVPVSLIEQAANLLAYGGTRDLDLAQSFRALLSQPTPTTGSVWIVREVDGTSLGAVPKVIGVALTAEVAERAVAAGEPPYRVRSASKVEALP